MDIQGLRVTFPADGIALLELDRPHRRNALDRALLDGLPGVLTGLAADDRVRALVVSGRGGAFCAGGDLDAIAASDGESPEEGRARMEREFATARLLLEFRAPTVAAVDGAAVGAGMALALACDLRIGSPEAVFASPFIRMALVPDWGVSWLLARAVGQARATEIALSARKVAAEEALRIGLLDAVVPGPLDEALARAVPLADAEPAAAAATKRLIAGSAGGFQDAIDAEIEAQLCAVRSPEFTRRMGEWSRSVRGR
ncbi:enoyl-CoA hydratase/isomerase family protein [Amycolatopsis sp. EV170708-02-1]|uniref:enoyl-CoA hydratase/isomerase family protein n=1 Tax=Amycolatopsis sp. EV170708-02-1 TaxID=2919322 RepID=UPI001F0BF864|nr:enoyl-CoA hydratase/isomerase family protein [Amycolatopsis sp. EV170708-02-1]UMP06882.1 enoyl-CoA hydratase/isomerase family protein [Amycolatopsis sp. EV170708-02-1]